MHNTVTESMKISVELRHKMGPAQEELQREVAKQFQLLADDRWHTVDAARSIEDVEADVRSHPLLAFVLKNMS